MAKTCNHPSLWDISCKAHFNLLPPQATYPPMENHNVQPSCLLMVTSRNILMFTKCIVQNAIPIKTTKLFYSLRQLRLWNAALYNVPPPLLTWETLLLWKCWQVLHKTICLILRNLGFSKFASLYFRWHLTPIHLYKSFCQKHFGKMQLYNFSGKISISRAQFVPKDLLEQVT